MPVDSRECGPIAQVVRKSPRETRYVHRDLWRGGSRAGRGMVESAEPRGAIDRGLTATESSMSRMLVRRVVLIRDLMAVVTVLAGLSMLPTRAAAIGGRHLDPAQIVPLDQIAPERRDAV